MTATDELRAMLDERGVEWWQSVNTLGCVFTRWYSPLFSDEVVAMENGDGELELFSHLMTPEQAIAATLGRGMLTADDVRDLIERHSDASGGNGRDFHNGAYVAIADELNATLGSCNCSNDCTNGERMDAPRLPHFWTHDGALHIEATRMPTRIVVCEGGTCEFVPKRELDASEAENAKLRELVKALLTCATDGDCDECRLNGATPWHVGKAQLCDGVWDRMRELGVRV